MASGSLYSGARLSPETKIDLDLAGLEQPAGQVEPGGEETLDGLPLG